MKTASKAKLLSLSFFILTSVQALAVTEYYDQRPDILKVQPAEQKNISEWSTANHGHFLFLAQTLTFFPTSDYYFLARDIEYLYDIAKLMAKDDPVLKSRIHLVPISTALSQKTEDMVKYLEQEGLTKKTLADRPALFIDSCCAGSVPDRIQKAFAKKGVEVQGFLIQAKSYPTSQMAEAVGANGLTIEDLPHYTYSAEEYVKDGGRMRIQARKAGPYATQASLRIMKQIRFDYDNAKKRKEFKELVGLMRTVYSYFVPKSPYKASSRAQAVDALKVMAEKFDVPVNAFLQDIQTMKRKSYATVDVKRLTEANKNLDLDGLERQALMTKWMYNVKGYKKLLDGSASSAETEIMLDVIKGLIELTPKEHGLTEQAYKKLMKDWVELYDENFSVPNETKDLKAYILASNIAFGGRKTLSAFYDKWSYGYKGMSSDKVKLFAQIAMQAIATEGYSYNKDSSLYFLVNDAEHIWLKSPGFLQAVMAHVIENVNDETLIKMTIDLFKNITEVRGYSTYDNAFIKEFTSVMRNSVEALPTISKPLVGAYLESVMLQYDDQKEFFDFGRWLFSQREYFEAEALKLKLSSHLRSTLPDGHELPPKADVSHMVDLHSGPVPIPAQLLKSAKGKLCSRIYSGK